MRRVLLFVAVAALVSSLAGAEVPEFDQTVRSGISNDPNTRSNGTLGSFSASIVQTGALEVVYSATVTTVGGDGAPLVTTVATTGGGSTVLSLNDQVRVAAQLYDSPWTAHTWTTFNGEYFVNSPTPLGSFTASFSADVPKEANYQVWAAAIAGHTWPGTSFNWFDITQGVAGNYYTITAGPMATTYIDNQQPPTPTPDPNAFVPTMNHWGVGAMMLLIGGVAILLITRRS